MIAIPWDVLTATAPAVAVVAVVIGAYISAPANWPTPSDLIHLVLGAVLAFGFLRQHASNSAAVVPAEGKLGPAAGGWSYGKVTPALATTIQAACPGDDQVFIAGESEESDREVAKHSRDMSFHKRSPPELVVYPETPEQVQAVVKAAHDSNVPVVPRGAGSGLEGGAIP